MVRCLVSAFFSFIVAASSPGQDPPKEPQKLRIQGKVIEAKNRQPIRKVTVEVVGGAGQSFGSHSATTRAEGTFTIEDVVPGRYAVNLQHPGFVQTMTNRGHEHSRCSRAKA
jgi:hypothetical protein